MRYIVSGSLLASALFAWAPIPGTLFVLFESFAVYLLALAALFFVFQLLAGRGSVRPAFAAVVLLAALVGWPHLLALKRDRPAQNVDVIVWHNVRWDDETSQQTALFAAEQGADYLILAETSLPVDGWWSEELEAAFPCRDTAPPGEARFVFIASRGPCVDPGVNRPLPEFFGWREIEETGRLRLGAAHVSRPRLGDRFDPFPRVYEDVHLTTIRQIADAYQQGNRTLFLGDLNMTGWSRGARLLSGAGLMPVPCGAVPVSWRREPFLWLGIDLVFASGDLAVECRLGPWHGSDHRVMMVRVEAR